MRTLSFISTRRASALASRSVAGTLTLNSCFSPSERVSVTCIVVFFRVRPAHAGPEIVKIFGARPCSLCQWFGEPTSRPGKGPPEIVGQTPESAWCGRRDSNPHNFRHWNLNPARLPVPPRPREVHHRSGRDAAGGGL